MEYDYIIVGAGSAGCIVAARLSEDPSLRVLLIEAGGSDRSLIIAMPAALPFVYQSRKLGWGYQSGPEPYLDGRTLDEKRGKVIGGSSSINAMLYNRGNPLDFEGWANAGLTDWSYAHCLPYFRRMETFSGGADDWRGGDGPMRISRCEARHKLYDAFQRAGEQAGHQITEDHNGYRQEGLHIAQVYIHEGRRWTPADGYLRPAMQRANLTVWAKTTVTGLVIENGAATGVTVERDGEAVTVRCAREMILCAGAINTPQLLMLSGIGDADELRTLGIEVKAHVPGVGRHLENHPGINIQFTCAREHSLVSELDLIGRARLGVEWMLFHKGLGATNFFEAGAFLRMRDDLDYPNMQYEFLPLTRQVRNGKLVAIPGFQFFADLSRPESHGRVTLRSANPTDAPSIVFNHLQSLQDVRDMVQAVKIAREMAAQPALARYQGVEFAPGPDVRTDAEIEAFIRANASTAFHPAGTCRMGADDAAVVDGEGRVKAVPRLRIVDGSIMPKIVTANLSASIMMMAEKISDRILGRKPLEPSKAPFFGAVRPSEPFSAGAVPPDMGNGPLTLNGAMR